MKNPTMKNCDFVIKAVQDDLAVRGNALASGNAAADRKCEDEILARLDQGDVWAWAFVTVKCKWNGFEGEDTLGACSYADAQDFQQPGGYFDDMKAAAYEDMLANIKDVKNRLTMFEE